MCNSLTVYHICGHINLHKLFKCSDAITWSDGFLHPNMANSGDVEELQRQQTYRPCMEVIQDTNFIPTICQKCKELCVVGDWVEKQSSEAKANIAKAWRRMTMKDKVPDNESGSLQELVHDDASSATSSTRPSTPTSTLIGLTSDARMQIPTISITDMESTTPGSMSPVAAPAPKTWAIEGQKIAQDSLDALKLQGGRLLERSRINLEQMGVERMERVKRMCEETY